MKEPHVLLKHFANYQLW